MANDVVLNENIRSPQVRLVSETGEQLGIVPTRDALNRARDLNLDLVMITAPSNGGVPVCKILDAGKWLYERKKAEKATARRQREHNIETKEIQLRPVTSSNDLDIKTRKAREFLKDGDKVKVVVKFKGREMSHKNKGRDIIAAFLSGLGEHKVERPITDGGNTLTLLVAPMKAKIELLRREAALA